MVFLSFFFCFAIAMCVLRTVRPYAVADGDFAKYFLCAAGVDTCVELYVDLFIDAIQ